MARQLFKPIKQEKLSVKIANQIKSLIIDGQLKPGDSLPPERELMQLLNVSRPSIREALKSLVGMGFLEVSKGNRTVVKSLAAGTMLDPLHYLLKDDIKVIFELLEVRKAIEAWNAYYAAKRATAEDIAQMEKNIESMRVKLDQENFSLEKEDVDFHLAISKATHNQIQTHIMFTIYEILKSSIIKYHKRFNLHKILQHHLEIVEAIKKRNSDLARRKVLEHLNYVESMIKNAVGSSDEFSSPHNGFVTTADRTS